MAYLVEDLKFVLGDKTEDVARSDTSAKGTERIGTLHEVLRLGVGKHKGEEQFPELLVKEASGDKHPASFALPDEEFDVGPDMFELRILLAQPIVQCHQTSLSDG
jgi:hypothetical protein